MRRILGLLVASLALGVAPELFAGGGRPQATFRIHLQRVEAGGSPSQVFQVALANPNQVIAVGRYAEINENHVQGITPTPDGGMMVFFDGTGTKLLEGITSSSMGRILVVFLNGRVVYAPEIDVPLRGGRMLIPGPLDAADRESLLLFLQKRDKR